MSKSKHWWHITLSVSARGLTTTPFPSAGQNLELTLDLTAHQLAIDSSAGWNATLPLAGQSAAGLCQQISTTLVAEGIELESDNWADRALPAGAYWHTEGWTGAILRYAAVVASEQPLDLLLEYLRKLQAHGKRLMAWSKTSI